MRSHYDGGLTCALSVSDLDRSMKWFQDILGFELLYHKEDMGWCELKSPVANVNLGLSQVEKMNGRGGNAVLTWGVKNLDRARGELESKEVRFDGETQTIPGMVKLATFFDPDDNCLMLYEDLSAVHFEGL